MRKFWKHVITVPQSKGFHVTSVGIPFYALNFAADEFNPLEFHVLEELMPRVREGRFIVQPSSEESFGHLAMAYPGGG
jgi:hypothetical protein